MEQPQNKAAQFSPIAALTGYDDAVKETVRLTDTKAQLDKYEKAAINERLNIIHDELKEQPGVSITYFLPDKKKSSGAYVTATGSVKKVEVASKNSGAQIGSKIFCQTVQKFRRLADASQEILVQSDGKF